MTQLQWKSGSGFDFFVSIYVLNRPHQFGLRPSWAAGVRSRLQPPHRALFEETSQLFPVPLFWLGNLSDHIWSAKSLIQVLEKMPYEDGLMVLMDRQDASPTFWDVLRSQQKGDTYSPDQVEILRKEYHKSNIQFNGEMLAILRRIWMSPEVFFGQYLDMLNSYHQVFFEEEEDRIHPRLEEGLDNARHLAEQLTTNDLVDRLSKGVHFNILNEINDLILAPSYWASPFVFFRQTQPGNLFLIFGCRSDSRALVPGEPVPEGLLNGLKALADPTRLRILRYLVDEPLTPSELAKRLRLRPPTVSHHLSALRLAGLVQIEINLEGERLYALRPLAFEDTFFGLNNFLGFTVAPTLSGSHPTETKGISDL